MIPVAILLASLPRRARCSRRSRALISSPRRHLGAVEPQHGYLILSHDLPSLPSPSPMGKERGARRREHQERCTRSGPRGREESICLLISERSARPFLFYQSAGTPDQARSGTNFHMATAVHGRAQCYWSWERIASRPSKASLCFFSATAPPMPCLSGESREAMLLTLGGR